MKWFLLVIVLSACSNKQDAEAEKRARCEEGIAPGVAKTVNRRMAGPMAKSEDAKQQAALLESTLKAKLLELCTKDDWPDTVIECYKTSKDASTCKDGLKPEHRTNYTRAMMRVMLETARPQKRPPPAGSGSGSAGSGSAGSAEPPAPLAPPAGSGSAAKP